VAPGSPGECFEYAIEAFRIAVKYMTPVFFLSDGYLANGSEPWRIPEPEELPVFEMNYCSVPDSFAPYRRDPRTLARAWVAPGTPGHEHRIGGLEKQDVSGEVSYDSANHEQMVSLRAHKIAGIAADIPDLEVHGDGRELLVLGWGSTYGAIRQAVDNARAQGYPVASAHLRHIHPLPANTGSVLRRFRHVLVPELNLGQLRMLLRARFLVDVIGLNKLRGQPFLTGEIEQRIREILDFGTRRSLTA
jgi:2-oxoglutarate ferredoxin oxidoreductase subunit alpha